MYRGSCATWNMQCFTPSTIYKDVTTHISQNYQFMHKDDFYFYISRRPYHHMSPHNIHLARENALYTNLLASHVGMVCIKLLPFGVRFTRILDVFSTWSIN